MKERVLAWGHSPREITVHGASVKMTHRHAITGDPETGDYGVSMETNLCGHTFMARQRLEKLDLRTSSETLQGLANVVDDTLLAYVSDNLDKFADVLMGSDSPLIFDDIEDPGEYGEFCDQFGLYDDQNPLESFDGDEDDCTGCLGNEGDFDCDKGDFDPDTGEYCDEEEEDVLRGGFYEDIEYDDEEEEDFGYYSEEEWE